MPRDDRTTSSDPRASRSQRRSIQEQEAKRRAAPSSSSSRSMQPGAQSSSSTDVSVEADLESRNNHRGSRDSRDHHHRHRGDNRERESSRRHRTGSHDRDDRDERDRQSKRRAAGDGKRSTKVGATSVSDGGSKDERRKRREDDDRRSKQRARRPGSTSGASAVAPGASHGRSPTRSAAAGRSPARNRDAVERKLAAAGLGMNDKNDKKDNGKNEVAKNFPDLGGGAAAAVGDAPDAASVDDDGAIQIQAVLVDDKEKPSSAKDEMARENERLRREMTAENERLRQQMQEDQNKLREEVQQSNREEAEAKAKKKKQRNICIVIVVLVLIGAGVGAFFGTQGGDESTASSLATTTTATPAPTTGITPATPTESPIAPEVVTAAPTEVPPLHEAPSDEDCTNIANADPVDGQDDAEVYGFDTTLEMTLAGSLTNSVDDALPILQEQMQSRLMTSIAGCTPQQLSSGEQRRLRAVANNTERQLQANKYVVLNAQIASMEVLEGETCKVDAPAGCSKVLAKMNMYLQGEERPFVLMNRLIQLLNGGDDNDFDLARSLGLPNGVRSLALESISPDTPTEAPTPNPSEIPSVSPSTAPTTTQATPGPTQAPVTTPVPTTTRPPRPPPTSMPTPEPTECTDKCNGDRACEGLDVEFFDLGCGSCNGDKSCLNAAADIGDESCKDGACEGFDGGGVGDYSCTGRGACKDLVDVTIGDGACKCEGCCACIREGDTIPDGSCNAIAESKEDVEYVPYETTRRVEFCCRTPNSGGGGGGEDPGDEGEGGGKDFDEEGDEDGGEDGGGGANGGAGTAPPRPPQD
ncbi:MAG: hypothetical protein SGBAC_002324 [Bacillariaceae sp.]